MFQGTQFFHIQPFRFGLSLAKNQRVGVDTSSAHLQSSYPYITMEPIPLCTLTVLLNYERMISDPRFKGERLMNISIVDPPMVQRMLEVANVVGQLTGPRPSSIQWVYSF